MDAVKPIGLTGVIAGGKSTVLSLLREMGLKTASSDVIARELFAEASIQAAITARTGLSSPVSSAALREAMLRDPSLRRWINVLMHPLVSERVSQLEVDVIEVPLLFEACLQNRYREVWTVACGPAERERRLRERYGPEVDLRPFGRWQLTEATKNALADVIIRTDRSIEAVNTVLKAEVARSFPLRIALPK